MLRMTHLCPPRVRLCRQKVVYYNTGTFCLSDLPSQQAAWPVHRWAEGALELMILEAAVKQAWSGSFRDTKSRELSEMCSVLSPRAPERPSSGFPQRSLALGRLLGWLSPLLCLTPHSSAWINFQINNLQSNPCLGFCFWVNLFRGHY